MNPQGIRDRLYEDLHKKFHPIHVLLDDEGQTELDGIIWDLAKDLTDKICNLGQL
jgi:hypothetical protein